jgi:hypothetical protein
VAPLLVALAHELPNGSRLCLTTPIGRELKARLKAIGSRQPGFLRRSEWYVERGDDGASILQLAEFARSRKLKSFSVWLFAFSRDGAPLVEAEDSNDYIWLSSDLSQRSQERLVKAAGGARGAIANSPFGP